MLQSYIGFVCNELHMTPRVLKHTTFTNFSMKYHLVCKVYTDIGSIK